MRSLSEQNDGELLATLVSAESTAGFEELVRRHGAMVRAACQRLLGTGADADDAAQAVFLVLWKNATKLRQRASAAAWLHHVSRNICRNALRAQEIRRRREREAAEMRQPNQSEPRDDDLRGVLDEALDQLPEKYRLPLILFHFEQRSIEEIAELLGTYPSTIGTRLSRARELLRGRLNRSGVTLSAAALAAGLTSEAGATVVPAEFVSVTTQAAQLFAAGQVSAAGVLSPHAAALAKGGMQLMFTAKLKLIALVSAVLLVGGVVSYQLASAETEEQKEETLLLQGVWKITAMEKDGVPQPKASFDDIHHRLVFEGNTMMQRQTAPNGTEIKADKGTTFTLDPTTDPKSIDMKNPMAVRAILGIYEIDEDTLKLCLNLKGDRPAAFKTTGKGQFYYEAQRVKEK